MDHDCARSLESLQIRPLRRRQRIESNEFERRAAGIGIEAIRRA